MTLFVGCISLLTFVFLLFHSIRRGDSWWNWGQWVWKAHIQAKGSLFNSVWANWPNNLWLENKRAYEHSKIFFEKDDGDFIIVNIYSFTSWNHHKDSVIACSINWPCFVVKKTRIACVAECTLPTYLMKPPPWWQCRWMKKGHTYLSLILLVYVLFKKKNRNFINLNLISSVCLILKKIKTKQGYFVIEQSRENLSKIYLLL